MKEKRQDQIKKMVLMGVFLAIMIIQSVVPMLGYIPLGFMNATIIHVTVIIGAVLLGAKNGAMLGFCFGMSSLLRNTFSPNPTSFCFSPFAATGPYQGNLYSLFVCFVPRIMIGIIAYYVYDFWKKREHPYIGSAWAGVIGSMCNSILVMGSIYLFFGHAYTSITNKTIYGIVALIGTQGVVEAIVAGIITLAVVRALKKA